MDNELSIIDYEELDKEIDKRLKEEFESLDSLKQERVEIGDPKKLVDSISQIVWEQFIIQLTGTAGKDFVAQNGNLNLSLKKADHIINPEDFSQGKIPSHNFANKSIYQKRYTDWDSNFSDPNHENLAAGYRDPYDANRPHGAGTMAKDHTVPVAEIVRDKKIAAFMSEEEKVNFANDTNVNLKDLDREANASKGDRSMREWLDSERDGKHPDERFNINKKELLERDDKARADLKNRTNEAEKRAIAEGRASMMAEVKRSAVITGQAVAVALLAKLTRHIFQQLIYWLMDKDRKTSELIGCIKKGITDFIFDFKNNVLLSADVAVTVILTQIFGEIIPTIRKALVFFMIGGRTVRDVVKYLRNPENEKKDTSVKVLEIGKIVTIGLTTAGGIVLSTAITALLIKYVPALGKPIPILGSPAGLIGIFVGGITAGIVGAIILHKIDGALEGKKLNENRIKQLSKENEIIQLQNKQFLLYFQQVDDARNQSLSNVQNDLLKAREEMEKMRASIDEKRESENDDKISDVHNLIDSLEW